jgi:Family of unknown function (DUF6600)
MAASAATQTAQADPPIRVGRLNYLEGSVSFQPAGLTDWEEPTVNRPLVLGDNLWVGDGGRAEIHVGSTALRLGQDTAFRFLNLDDQTVQVSLSEGTLTVRMRYLEPNQVFEVDTPNLAFNLVQPGEYRIDTDPNSQTTYIIVRDGEGQVTGGGQTFPVYARQQVVVRGMDQIAYNLAAIPAPDSWDQWCDSRDRREDQVRSARYVSHEMDGYEDLDWYGRWEADPGYGNVWIPNSVPVGWAPYHDGHWVWIEPWGWTWVDEAPWGFAPYHYGRWAYLRSRWCWIPGPYVAAPVYAPALVAWIGGGGRGGFSLSFSIGTAAAVAWFPLGPREPYIPWYQVSQNYFTRVNTTNTVINNTTIINYYNYSRDPATTPITNIRYVNRMVPNAVIAAPQDSFARGRSLMQEVRPVSSAQLASLRVVTAPSVVPQRESVLGPKADTVSRAPRPPANVLSRPVVARTAPAPSPVPFDRQQPALARNPGRPLPTDAVRQIRQNAPAPAPPVRIVDMGRVKRVEPRVAGGPGAPQTPQQNAPQPSFGERQNGPPGRQRQQPQAMQPPQAAPRQPAPQNAPPPSQANERGNGRGRPESQTPQALRPQPPAAQQQAPPPQPSFGERQNGPPGRQRQQPQAMQPPQAAPRQPAPQNAPPPSQANERGNGRGRQRPEQQPEGLRPQPPAPQAAAQQQAPPPQQHAAPAPPPQTQPAEPPQGREGGNQHKKKEKKPSE